MPTSETETKLLDAAERLIGRGGYERLSPAEAASLAGVEDRDGLPDEWELFAGVIGRDEARFNAEIDAILAAGGSASQSLLSLIERCVSDHDWSLWIELWSLALRDQRARGLREELDGAFRIRIEGLIEAGVAADELDVPEPRSAAIAIAALIDALAVEATLGDDTVSPNYMLKACASVAGELIGAELRLPGREEDA